MTGDATWKTPTTRHNGIITMAGARKQLDDPDPLYTS